MIGSPTVNLLGTSIMLCEHCGTPTDLAEAICRSCGAPAAPDASVSTQLPTGDQRPSDSFTYDAFISYKHGSDKLVAVGVQAILQTLGKPWWRLRAMRIFRDDTTLVSTHELWPTIERALSRSRHLILMASPESARSPWVDKEVAYWLRHRSLATLSIVVTAGHLNWQRSDFEWTDDTPLPLSLRDRFAAEPLWVDLRAYRGAQHPPGKQDREFVARVASIAAAILGRAKEDLLSDELRQQRRNLTWAWSAAAGLAVLATVAGWMKMRADENAAVATEQRDAALITQSRFLTDLSTQALQSGDAVNAVHLAMAALPEIDRDGRIVTTRPDWAPARAALDAAMREVRELAVLKGHTGQVTYVGISEDGSKIISAATDGTVRTWDAIGWRETGSIQAKEAITAVAMTQDGSIAVTGHAKGTVKLWNLETFRELAEMRGHSGEVKAIVLTPNQNIALTGSADRTLRAWDLIKGSPLARLPGFTNTITDLAVGNNTFAAISGKLILRTFEVDSGSELPELKFDKGGWTSAVAVAKDDSIIAVASGDVIRIFDAKTSKETSTFRGHKANIRSIAISSSGSFIASGDYRGVIYIWANNSVLPAVTLAGHLAPITSLAIQKDDQRIVSGSEDGTIRVWALRPKREITVLRTIVPLPANVEALRQALEQNNDDVDSAQELAIGSNLLVAGNMNHTTTVWDVESGRQVAFLRGHSSAVNAVAVTPDGSRIITGSGDHTIKIWDAKSGAEQRTLTGHDNSIQALTVTGDGTRLISGSYDGTARVWDIDTGRQLAVLKGHIAEITSVAVSPDGRYIVTGSGSGDEELYGGLDHTARIWDANTGAELMVLRGHTDMIKSVTVSPDGKKYVTGSGDGSARICRPSALVGQNELIA